MGDPRPHLGDPQDPGRRRRAAAARPRASRSRPGAAASPRLRRAAAGRFGATRAGTSRSTASGSTSAPISGRPGSATSGRMACAAAGRPVSTKLALPDPPADAGRVPWALRSTDLDANGHVNNAVYWQAVEDWCAREGIDRVLAAPRRARLPRPDRPRRSRRAGDVRRGRRTRVASRSSPPAASGPSPRLARSAPDRAECVDAALPGGVEVGVRRKAAVELEHHHSVRECERGAGCIRVAVRGRDEGRRGAILEARRQALAGRGRSIISR